MKAVGWAGFDDDDDDDDNDRVNEGSLVGWI